MTFHYERRLPNGITILNTRAEHAEQLEKLQEIVFPTLAKDELIRAEHYRHHIVMFPEGQFCALDGDRVVGMTTSIRQHFDLEHPHPHTFADLLQGGWATAHDEDGEWLYGLDMGTHPDYRQRGIARALYAARHATVHRLGLKGQLGGAMLVGYGALKDQMSAEEYLAKVVAGEIYDQNVSTQMRIGWKPLYLLPNYVNDPICANYSVQVVLWADVEV